MTPLTPTSPACPRDADLARLGLDSMDDIQFLEIEAHVRDCPACQERLEQLARIDTPPPNLARPNPNPEPLPPPEIPGYTLGRELGRGGSGVVYEAVQILLNRPVAIKVLASGPALDPSTRARWLREARAISKVRHLGIVRLYEAGEHKGRPFLVLDLIPGGSLRDRAEGPLPAREAARLIAEVAEAVHQVHQAGILHLDIKPSNILLDGPPDADWSRMSPMLSDFGIALDQGERQSETSVSGGLGTRGTPAFMAPEQVAGRRAGVGPQADVFALGATLYALLAGRPPFQGASPIETLDLLRSRDPAPLRALLPALPRDLETICLACLQKEPARRYATAAALAEDLRRWLAGEPILARAESPAEKWIRWCRRHPAQATLGAALVATVVLSLVALTALWRRSESQRIRAEAALARAIDGETAAGEAVGSLLELLQQSIESPERLVSERVRDGVVSVLDLTAKLRRSRNLTPSQAVEAAKLECQIADYRLRQGDIAGAVRLTTDAVDLLRGFHARFPDDPSVADGFARSLIRSANLALTSNLPDDGIREVSEAREVLLRHVGRPYKYDTYVEIYGFWAAFAVLRSGKDSTPAMRQYREYASDLVRRRPDDPIFRLLFAFADRPPSADRLLTLTPSIREALGALPDGTELPNTIAVFVADSIACRFRDEALAPAEGEPAPPERLSETFDALLRGHHLGSSALGIALERVGQRTCLRIVDERRAGRLDRARRAIASLIAFGRAQERRHPSRPEPHFLISLAHEQEAKLAWLVPNPQAAESALRESLSEASTAVALAPESVTARQHLAGIREKLVRLVAREPE